MLTILFYHLNFVSFTHGFFTFNLQGPTLPPMVSINMIYDLLFTIWNSKVVFVFTKPRCWWNDDYLMSWSQLWLNIRRVSAALQHFITGCCPGFRECLWCNLISKLYLTKLSTNCCEIVFLEHDKSLKTWKYWMHTIFYYFITWTLFYSISKYINENIFFIFYLLHMLLCRSNDENSN